MYIEANVLGGRRLVECAVIEGDAIETLMYLNLFLKKWNMIHQSFPHKNLPDFEDRQQPNKGFQSYYFSLLNI